MTPSATSTPEPTDPSGATDWTLAEISALSFDHLESYWAKPVELSRPRGLYRGHVLGRIDHPTSRRPIWRWSERIGFEWAPFGIDFDRRLWFFFTARLAMGRFDIEIAQSRWRDTEAVGLHYESSKLPHGIRRWLYDEVKPLSDKWMLGIGGINAGPGEGDHFYFALERVQDRCC